MLRAGPALSRFKPETPNETTLPLGLPRDDGASALPSQLMDVDAGGERAVAGPLEGAGVAPCKDFGERRSTLIDAEDDS